MIAHNIPAAVCEPDVQEVLRLATQAGEIKFAPTTWRCMGQCLRKLAGYAKASGWTQWSSLKASEIDAWVAGSPSPGTRQSRRCAANYVARFVARGWKVRSPRPMNTEPQVRSKKPVPSREEVSKFLDTRGAGARAWRRALQVALELAYGSGLRLCEIVRLKLEDIDLERKQAKVLGKGRKERMAALTGEAINQIVAWAIARAQVTRAESPDTLLLTDRGNAVSTDRAQKWLVRRNKEEGINPSIQFHELRRACGTHLAQRGASLEEVRQYLGHSSITTTQIYVKVSAAEVRAVYDKCHPRGGSPAKTEGGAQ